MKCLSILVISQKHFVNLFENPLGGIWNQRACFRGLLSLLPLFQVEKYSFKNCVLSNVLDKSYLRKSSKFIFCKPWKWWLC